jgi:hypothetical protein
MHLLIVEFDLQGLDATDYEAVADDLTPTFAAVPGLLTKTWIADRDTGSAGGVYVWESAARCDAFLAGDLFAAMRTNPALANLRTRRYDVVGVTAPEPAVA